MYTAATWFHRFYMRYSMEDYHRQDVAASCIFLATKTEECGRKLRDVAKVYHMKVTGADASQVQSDSSEVELCQTMILQTEEALLEALCFDFVVDNPHAELVDLFDALPDEPVVQEYAWSFANDSYRTPLCVLYPPRVVAAACYILAQRVADGPQSASLDARLSSPAPVSSLPTPPSHKATSPNGSRFAIEHFAFNEVELAGVADALAILLEFYNAQDVSGSAEYLQPVVAVTPPAVSPRKPLYQPFAQVSSSTNVPDAALQGRTPNSSYGGNTPSKEWKPVG
ncbi:cyclin-like protein [Gloeophyllum trabeum ATCC 11539]|uniref:Cyclin-like protein n=1 Tax=Gloeophyllum trabeum (strain ATCC 11539 / FP-39264 / Madison 617) TaxID=670483 RepID=S7RTX0_GLOTA|nr:cyclin-like protein [Gloeophyllum trabeum ATCC 11539]EPQ58145.1 cyclin-like protein [Gloeophyllum trabeum ATCC 11539]